MSDQNIFNLNSNHTVLFSDNHGSISTEASAAFFSKEKEFINAHNFGEKGNIYEYVTKGKVDYWSIGEKENKNFIKNTYSDSKYSSFDNDLYGNVYASPDQGGIYGPSNQMGIYNFGPVPSSWISPHNRHLLTRSYADYYKNNIADQIGKEILGRPLTEPEKQNNWNSIYDTVDNRLAINRVLTPYEAARSQYMETIKNIRSSYIENSPYVVQSAHKMFDNFYGNINDGDLRWYKEQLKSGKGFETIWQEEARSGRMRTHVLDMINGVQDRNDAKEEWDAPYIDGVTNSIANHNQTFLEVRNNLIDGTSQFAAHKMFDNFYGNTSNGDIAWYNDQLHSGKTTQQVWQEEAHSGRMRAHVMDMINGVQDRNDAKEEWDGKYINGFTDRLANRSASFNDMRNELIDGTSRGSAEKMFNSFYGHTDQNDWNWYRDQLHSGKTTQQIWNEEIRGDRGQYELKKVISRITGSEDNNNILMDYFTKEILERKNFNEIIRISDYIKDPIKSFDLTKVYLKHLDEPDMNYRFGELLKDVQNGKITIERILQLDTLSATIFNIQHNEGENNYTIVESLPSTAYEYTDSQGNKFFLDSRVTFQSVMQEAAKDLEAYWTGELTIGVPDIQIKTLKAMLSAVGQGGKFDIQRDNSAHIIYRQLEEGANYLVGVYAYKAGYTEAEMNFLGKKYGQLKSLNSSSKSFVKDMLLWHTGYNDTKSGIVK